jgi:predicted  nucleic acid-binding Zn-ribbon protein
VGGVAKQIDEAESEKDRKKAEVLSQKLTELETKLGPDYLALIESLRNANLTSEDGQAIMSAFDTVDESCPH